MVAVAQCQRWSAPARAKHWMGAFCGVARPLPVWVNGESVTLARILLRAVEATLYATMGTATVVHNLDESGAETRLEWVEGCPPDNSKFEPLVPRIEPVPVEVELEPNELNFIKD